MNVYRFDGPEHELALIVARSKKAAAQIVRANFPEYDTEEFLPERHLRQLVVPLGRTPFIFMGPDQEILIMVAESQEQATQQVREYLPDYADMIDDWIISRIRQVDMRQSIKILSFSQAVC